MNGAFYISVILPLKLEWEPCYSLPSGMNSCGGKDGGCVTRRDLDRTGNSVKVGDRVKVPFAGKVYSGVVSKVGVEPETDPSKIKPIISIEEGLEPVLGEEMELWRQVAGYFLCSIGEVYKAAYPIGKINLEEARAAALKKALLKFMMLERLLKLVSSGLWLLSGNAAGTVSRRSFQSDPLHL